MNPLHRQDAGAEVPRRPGARSSPPEDDPRHALVDWMAKPDNPFFARALVNRMWGHFLGRGLVDEVDDLRETNPPSNPELLDALAKDFVDAQVRRQARDPHDLQQPGLPAQRDADRRTTSTTGRTSPATTPGG